MKVLLIISLRDFFLEVRGSAEKILENYFEGRNADDLPLKQIIMGTNNRPSKMLCKVR